MSPSALTGLKTISSGLIRKSCRPILDGIVDWYEMYLLYREDKRLVQLVLGTTPGLEVETLEDEDVELINPSLSVDPCNCTGIFGLDNERSL